MPRRSESAAAPERVGNGPTPDPDDDGGPLRALSFVVLLALAIEIGLFALLGRAAA